MRIRNLPNPTLTTDEIEELQRLQVTSIHDYSLNVWMSVYSAMKLKLSGQKALVYVNANLPDDNKIEYEDYRKITKLINARSRLLANYSKGENTNRFLVKLKEKVEKLIDGITDEKIQKASLRDIGMTFGIIFDKVRLMENKPTSNVAVAGKIENVMSEKLMNELKELNKDIRRLELFAEKKNIRLTPAKRFEYDVTDGEDIIHPEEQKVLEPDEQESNLNETEELTAEDIAKNKAEF